MLGQETSDLANKVLDSLLKIKVGEAGNNFCRFFDKALQGWRIVERFPDLTSVADIQMLKKRFDIKEISRQLYNAFKTEFAQSILGKLLVTEKFISGFDNAFDLKRNLKDFQRNNQEFLRNTLER